ncbi:MAG: hypothetical protein ACKV2T_01870 [Kofleriaceae bacterium]
MSSRPAAADFIRANIAVHGLLGSAVRVPEDTPWQPLPTPTFELTRDNHHSFGFDGVAFGRRRTFSATYWVEFGRPARPPGDLRTELRAALMGIRAQHAALSIGCTGGIVAEVIAAEAMAMGVPLDGIALDLEGHGAPHGSISVAKTRHRVSWEEFTAFAMHVAHEEGCGDAFHALDAMHATFGDATHLFSRGTLALVRHSHDAAFASDRAPVTWAVASYEQATWVHRWLLGNGRRGIPHVLLWTPELVAAVVDAPTWRRYIDPAAPPPPPRLAHVVLRETYPEIAVHPFESRYEDGVVLRRKLQALSGRMRSVLRGRRATHYTPFDRFARHLGVQYDATFTDPTYGRNEAR